MKEFYNFEEVEVLVDFQSFEAHFVQYTIRQIATVDGDYVANFSFESIAKFLALEILVQQKSYSFPNFFEILNKSIQIYMPEVLKTPGKLRELSVISDVALIID